MKPDGLADLDELILRCRDEKAKSYISEAVACYRVGAYRQCIVATWIAVSYDIIHKLQDLDLTGDKKARKKLEEFEQIWQTGDIKKALDFERQILDMAKGDFELLSNSEYNDLVRLREDRNRCAHPSLNTIDEVYQPTAELARTHLRNSVTHLLQREPVQGKAALDRLTSETKSQYFPVEVDKAVSFFQNGPLARPRESLVRNFSIVLIKTLLLEELDDQAWQQNIAALNATRQLHHSIVEDTLNERLNDIMKRVGDVNLDRCIRLLGEVKDTWQYLDDDVRIRLQNYARSTPDDNIVPCIIYALDIDDLHDAGLRRLSSINSLQLYELVKVDHQEHRKDFVDRAVQMYVNAESFYQANFIGSDLIIPLAIGLSPEQVEIIVQAARENVEILNSFDRVGVFNAIRRSRVIPETDFDALLDQFGFLGEDEDEIRI